MNLTSFNGHLNPFVCPLRSVEVRGKAEVDEVSIGELRGVIRVQVVVDAGAMQSTSRYLR